MKEVLEFIFSSWVHYLGTLVMLLVISKWRLVKIVNQGDDGIIDKLAAIGRAKQSDSPSE
jgi:hypothetical protein